MTASDWVANASLSSTAPMSPIDSPARASTFYVITGFHGLHVTGGLLAFLLVIGRSFAAKKFGHHEATSAVVTSYYWHFVDVVWIILFAAIYLLP